MCTGFVILPSDQTRGPIEGFKRPQMSQTYLENYRANFHYQKAT